MYRTTCRRSRAFRGRRASTEPACLFATTTRSITPARGPTGAHHLRRPSPVPDNPRAVAFEDRGRPPRPLSGGSRAPGSGRPWRPRAASGPSRPAPVPAPLFDSDRPRLVHRRAASPCPPRSDYALSLPRVSRASPSSRSAALLPSGRVAHLGSPSRSRNQGHLLIECRFAAARRAVCGPRMANEPRAPPACVGGGSGRWARRCADRPTSRSLATHTGRRRRLGRGGGGERRGDGGRRSAAQGAARRARGSFGTGRSASTRPGERRMKGAPDGVGYSVGHSRAVSP